MAAGRGDRGGARPAPLRPPPWRVRIAAASVPPWLPVELIRLAAPARGAPARGGEHRLRLPRIRPLREARRPPLHACLAGRRHRGHRPPGGLATGVRRRPRHGHLGRDRADGPRPGRRARPRPGRGDALQRQHAPAPGPADLRPEAAAQPAGPGLRPAHLGARVHRPVRPHLLARPSAERRGGGRPVVARLPGRRRPHRPPHDQLHGRARTLHRALARRDPRLARPADPGLGHARPRRPHRGAPRSPGPAPGRQHDRAPRLRALPPDRDAGGDRRRARLGGESLLPA